MHTVHVISPSHAEHAEKSLLALGYLFEVEPGYHNPFFDKIIAGDTINLNMNNYFGDLHTKSYFSYDGGVTTPPCL